MSMQKQSGQVGVMVLLISAIVLVIGLSIANRIVKENQSTVTQEDSARVFSTAEAGIQQALSNIFQFENSSGNLASTFSFEDANFNQVSIAASTNFSGFVGAAQAVEIRLNDGQIGSIDFDWSKQTCTNGGANLMIAHYFLDGGVANTYDVNYYVVGNCADYSDQNLIPATSSTEAPHLFHYTLNIVAGKSMDSFLRITPFNDGTDLMIRGSGSLFSSNQYTIISLAQMPDGSTSKAIEVKRSAKMAPTFMDFALISGTNLEK